MQLILFYLLPRPQRDRVSENKDVWGYNNFLQNYNTNTNFLYKTIIKVKLGSISKIFPKNINIFCFFKPMNSELKPILDGVFISSSHETSCAWILVSISSVIGTILERLSYWNLCKLFQYRYNHAQKNLRESNHWFFRVISIASNMIGMIGKIPKDVKRKSLPTK